MVITALRVLTGVGLQTGDSKLTGSEQSLILHAAPMLRTVTRPDIGSYDPAMAALDIATLTPSIGAVVHGVDLAHDLQDPAIEAAVKQAFLDHQVLVFRNQELSREQHKDFGRRFGPLHVHPSQRHDGYDGDREIFPVEADETTVLNNGGLWHSDVSCDAMPPLGSMLLLKEAPASGGDTLFANMYVAYETLSEPIRTMIDGLDAVHDMRQDIRHYDMEPRPGVEYPQTAHPLVVAHPETGRRLLFCNPAFTSHIVGLCKRESKAILEMLFDHTANNPKLHCRVQWEPGTLTFWDNRCVQHYAVWDYRPQLRIGERVTIASTVAPSRGV